MIVSRATTREAAMRSAAREQDPLGFGTLSIAITDATRGHPADGVLCLIEQQVDGNWQTVTRGASDDTGTVCVERVSSPGVYRIELDADPYFAATGVLAFMPKVTVIVRVPESCSRSVLHTQIAANSQFSMLTRNY
jgi:5-hydroxyisourate hydrolase-like protein (transthyretin family)